MKSISLENFIEERIKENRKLFTKKEIEYMEKNKKCLTKVYLLGAINCRNCYKKDRLVD